MTPPRSQQRRIALQTAHSVHDLALPGNEALGNALLALGLLPESRERILDPSGRVVDLDTRAEHLREGGLYSITAPSQRGSARHVRREGVHVEFVPWLVLATALLTLLMTVVIERRTGGNVNSLWLVGLGVAALLALLSWGRKARDARYVGIPVVVLTGVVFTLMWQLNAAEPPLALAAGMGAGAVAGAVISLAALSPETRAMGGPITVISGVLAVVLLAAPMLQWGVVEVAAVAGAAAGVGLRAVPSWIITVEDGHHVDYARFAQVRWSVRGAMPEYLPHVDVAQVRARVRVLDTRLRVATGYLSLLVAAGMASVATFLIAPTATQRVAAAVAVVVMALGVLLNSRRIAAPALRTPPRIAVAVGVIAVGVAVGMNVEILTGPRGTVVTATLLFASAVTAFVAVAIARGARSILWSRVGDIVEALSVALMLPAALVAVGTIDILRGVFSG